MFDGFEVLLGLYLNEKYHANHPTAGWFNASTAAASVRPGGSTQGVTPSNSASGNHGMRNLGANYSHVFVGMGIRCNAVGSFTGVILGLWDTTATAQVGLRINSDGSISVYRGASSADTLIGTSAAGAFALGSTAADYHMVELEVIFATGATGEVRVRVAGAQVLEVLTVQTANSANAYCNHIGLNTKTTGSANYAYDDLYLNDDSGSAPHNTFYGEAFVVERSIPNGDGDSSQWLGSDGNSVNNFQLVDDGGNDDTDYVASGTVSQEDTYAGSDLTNGTGTIIGVESNIVARKDDVATREIAAVLRPASTSYPQTTRAMAGTYALFWERVDINPETSLPWSIASINSNKIGQRVIT
jgi:hypothetical protein